MNRAARVDTAPPDHHAIGECKNSRYKGNGAPIYVRAALIERQAYGSPHPRCMTARSRCGINKIAEQHAFDTLRYEPLQNVSGITTPAAAGIIGNIG